MELLPVLDIGTDSVKFASVKEERGEYLLKEYHEESLSPETLVTRQGKSMLKNPEELESKIAAILGSSKSKRKEVAVSLPDHCATVLFKHIDRLFDDHFKQDYVRWRLRKILAASLVANSLIDYQVLGRQETDEGLVFQVIVEIVKEQLINDLASLVIKAGFTPVYFNINSFGLANFYHEYLERNHEKTNNYILINLGHLATTFSFFRDRTLVYLRTVPIGGFHFTTEIARIYEKSDSEAKTIKHTSDFFAGGDMDLDNIDRIFGSWLKELDITMQYYTKNNLMGRMEKIYLGGGSARLRGLDEFLYGITGLKAELVTINAVTSARDKPDDEFDLTARFGASVGSSLGEEKQV